MADIDLFLALEQFAIYRKGPIPDIQKNGPELKKMAQGYAALAQEAALPRIREALAATSDAVLAAVSAMETFLEVATDEGRVVGEHLRTLRVSTDDLDSARAARTRKEREAAERARSSPRATMVYSSTSTSTSIGA